MALKGNDLKLIFLLIRAFIIIACLISKTSNSFAQENGKIKREESEINIYSENVLKGFEELIVALRINYVDTNIVSTALKAHNNDILVEFCDLSDSGVKAEYLYPARATINNTDYINLSKLQGVSYEIDKANLVLIINFPPFAMPLQYISVWQQDKLDGNNAAPLKALLVDYDLTFTNAANQNYFAGVQSLKYSDGFNSIAHSVFAKKQFYGKKQLDIIRLDTSWSKEDEVKMTKWRVGDSITNSADWSSSTRFGGFQYTTDFSLNPNLITYPLVSFSGRADLPTALDVYANSHLVYKTELKTGDFNMDNLPVAAGKGSIEIRQQDITGKIKVITIPYYNVPSLLKEGLVDYSFDVGSQRIGYGTFSNKYRYLVTSFDYNKGMSSNWTSGVHFESMKDVFAVGTSNLYKLGNYGVLSGSLATSGPKLGNAQKLLLGYAFQAHKFGFSIQKTLSNKNFINVFNLDTSGVRNSTQASFSYSLTDKSSVGLSYISALSASNKDEKNKTEMLLLTYQNNLTKNSSMSISSGFDMKDKKNAFIALSFGLNLGSNYLSSSIYKNGSDWQKQASIASNSMDEHYLDLDYRVNLSHDKKFGYDAEFNKSFDNTDATLYLFNYGDTRIRQLSLVGSVAATSGGLFLSERINDSFAVVKVADFKKAEVYHNNQFVATTNEKGIAFIPSIPSYVQSKITVDEHTLPLSASFVDNVFVINPKRNMGVYVKFDISRMRSGEVTLVDNEGDVIRPDTDVIIEDIEEELFVGYDGKLYIPNLNDLKHLKGKACKDNVCCHFSISLDGMEDLEILDLGVQKCQSSL